jgi:hypothetical protein
VKEKINLTKSKKRKKIMELRKDAAAGPNGITPKLLRALGDSILKPLLMIFEKSLEEGKVPKEWKKATVVQFLKKGSKRETGNYRPVSLTSIPCKILESIIKDEMMKHLLTKNLIKDTQHGFMPGRS